MIPFSHIHHDWKAREAARCAKEQAPAPAPNGPAACTDARCGSSILGKTACMGFCRRPSEALK